MTTARSLLLGSVPVKLEYFPFEGKAEQVRIALAITGIPFNDVHIAMGQWQAKKHTTRHGALPEMTLPDGTVITDSVAMLRLVGEADEEGKLYPSDVIKRVKIEQVLGLVADLSNAWVPSLYLGMGMHEKFGHPANWTAEEKDRVVKSVRTKFVEEDLPGFMKHFKKFLDDSDGGFLTGEDLTIADLSAYQQVSR